MKEKLEALVPYIIILVVVILIRSFIVTPVRVNGGSMDDTLNHGHILILNKLDTKYERFDIVVLSDDVIGDAAIKRVIGMPGESIAIENGVLYINQEKAEDPYNTMIMSDMEEITLRSDEYFVMGDNREVSLDSRSFGPVNKEDLEGTASLRLYPFNKMGTVK